MFCQIKPPADFLIGFIWQVKMRGDAQNLSEMMRNIIPTHLRACWIAVNCPERLKFLSDKTSSCFLIGFIWQVKMIGDAQNLSKMIRITITMHLRASLIAVNCPERSKTRKSRFLSDKTSTWFSHRFYLTLFIMKEWRLISLTAKNEFVLKFWL